MPVRKPSELGRLLNGPEAENCFNYLKGSPQTLIISSGIVTVDGDGFYIVDTEDSAATDDLTRINGSAVGNPIRIRSADEARVITVKRGTNLKMPSDFTLNSIYDVIEFVSYGSDILVEIHRSSNLP